MADSRKSRASSLVLLWEWLTRRTPAVIVLRVYAQVARIVRGAPLRRYSEVTPQIFIGGQHRLHGWPILQSWGISAVVNLRRYKDSPTITAGRYLHLPTIDNTPPTLEDLERGVQFIGEAIEQGRKVYIHCGVGVGRAPTLLAAYLVSKGHTPMEAWQMIRRVRPFIWPMRAQIVQVDRFAAEMADSP